MHVCVTNVQVQTKDQYQFIFEAAKAYVKDMQKDPSSMLVTPPKASPPLNDDAFGNNDIDNESTVVSLASYDEEGTMA